MKAATTAFTFKTLLRHYAKRALTPRSLNPSRGLLRDYEPSDGAFSSTTPITAHLAPHDAAVCALVLLPAKLHDLGPDELLQMICRRRSGDKGNIGTETLSVSVWFVNSAVSV